MKKMFDSWGSHVKKIPLQGLLCLFILCLSLPLHAQNEEGKININVKDASVKEVLEVLKKYNYRLVYSTAVIDACKKKITLDMKKATPSQVLDEIFKETNLVYKIEGNLITIKEVKKDESLVAQGVVKDENGEPIPGVSVLIKGTVTGTATDNKGNFSLKVNKNSALIFSFLGMETKTVFVESEKPIQVVMREMNNEMDEVVVTGYQIYVVYCIIESRRYYRTGWDFIGSDVTREGPGDVCDANDFNRGCCSEDSYSRFFDNYW